jgi:hypothetical protein
LGSSEEYQARAIECLRLAQAVESPESKALLLEMAQTWVRFAQQTRERSIELNTLLSEYNTRQMIPAARSEPVMQQQQQVQPERPEKKER